MSLQIMQYPSDHNFFIIFFRLFNIIGKINKIKSLYQQVETMQIEQEIYNLSEFSTVFKKIDKDKKGSTLKALEFVLQVNKAIGFDEILIREGYETYPNKKQIEAKKQEEKYLAFFKYMKENLDNIESHYLKDASEIKLIEEAQLKDQNEYNYLLNKNSISKFIRDEAAHYQNVLDKYLQTIKEDQDQKGITTKKMHEFIIQLFTNRYTTVICNGQSFLKRDLKQIQLQTGQILIEYGKKFKDITETQAKQQFYIAEEEVLDYLTFWIKNAKNMFVLYARTQQRLSKQSKFISNQSHHGSIIHPSRMTAEQIVKREEQITNAIAEQLSNSKVSATAKNKSIALQSKTTPLKLNRSQKQQQQGSKFIENAEVMVQKQSNQDLLKKQIKRLFDFGCKRRYKLNKNTTFQEIQQESKSMNLEKFMYFCIYFQITQLINRQLITEYFKMFSANQRIIDFPKFEKIISKMVKTDPKVAQNLLDKIKFDVKTKKKLINKNKKTEGRLSGYKFMLHPINGKDISTIEKELSYRRLQKLIVREEKQKKALVKRQKGQKQESRVSKIPISHSVPRVNYFELEAIRDISFDPQKFIHSNEKDHLWQAYEAKIWKKEEKSMSALQSILSKRMQRRNQILQKLNSQRSFIYNP